MNLLYLSMAPEAQQKPILYYVYRLLAVTIPALLLYAQSVREAKIKAETVKAQSKLGYEKLADTTTALKTTVEAQGREIENLRGYCQALGELHHRAGPSRPIIEMSTATLPKLAAPEQKPVVKAVPMEYDALR